MEVVAYFLICICDRTPMKRYVQKFHDVEQWKDANTFFFELYVGSPSCVYKLQTRVHLHFREDIMIVCPELY